MIELHYSLTKRVYKFGLFREQHDHLYCALLGDSAVYEVDLSENRLLRKYGFVDGSRGQAVWISRAFIVVGVTAQFDSTPYNAVLSFDRSQPTDIYGASTAIKLDS